MKTAEPTYPMQRFEAFGANLYVIYTKEEWDIFFEAMMKEKVVAVDKALTGSMVTVL